MFELGTQEERTKADYFTYIGLVTGGVLGILGFWIFDTAFFILLPALTGLLGLGAGWLVDKKEEIESKKKIFENKL